MAKELSVSSVRDLVRDFWRALLHKNAQTLRDFYSDESLVFGSHTDRAEAGIVAASRRAIEYFGQQMELQGQVGTVAVQLINDQTAIASYTFNFSATESGHQRPAATTYEQIRQGRATQVFAPDRTGATRIIHEHFSLVPSRKG